MSAERNCPRKTFKAIRKRFEKREKRSEKTIRNVFENILAPLRLLKKFHRHFSTNFKSLSPPKGCTKKKFFFHREALQGWPRQRVERSPCRCPQNRSLVKCTPKSGLEKGRPFMIWRLPVTTVSTPTLTKRVYGHLGVSERCLVAIFA